MRIALDYDGTANADLPLWKSFIELCKARGHVVEVLTMRHECMDEIIDDLPIKAHYTSRKAKKIWCEENGIHFDIWIDDTPEWLFQDAQ